MLTRFFPPDFSVRISGILKNKTTMEPSVFKVKRLTEHAILPIRSSAKAAGYDLSSAYDYIVPKRGKILVKTDLAIAVPEGYYGRVAPRSGLALKHFIDVGAGVVDSDYRGNLGVVLFNHAEEDFEIKKGDRIAQLILEKITLPEILEVDELDETERGSGGFGSTGGFANVNDTKRLKLDGSDDEAKTNQ